MLVIQRMEKIRRDFLWPLADGEHKFHLVEWKAICKFPAEGGLGFRSLKLRIAPSGISVSRGLGMRKIVCGEK